MECEDTTDSNIKQGNKKYPGFSFVSYLLVPDAVVDEDEDAVEGVKDAEGGSNGEGGTVKEEQSQGPGEHHEQQQCDGTSQPSPEKIEK